jgi:hypothetical protein
MARLSQLMALGVLAAGGVACQSAHGQVLRFYAGPGIVVRAPYVGGIRLGVGPYRPGIVGIGPRPLLARRAIIGAPVRGVDPRGLAMPYAPGATRLTSADPPPAPEVTGQQFPSSAQLAEFDDGSLLNALLAILSQFDADLGRFDTGASWQRYLALPDEALPAPMADGSVTPNWDSLATVHARLEDIAENPDYSMISGMESFHAARNALAEVLQRQPGVRDAGAVVPAGNLTSDGAAEELPLPAPSNDRSVLER